MRLQQVVIFNPKMRCFWNTVDKKRLKGLTELLRTTFYPRYSYRESRGPATPAQERVPGVQGMKRGILVDRQVAAITEGRRVRRPHPFTRSIFAALKTLKLTPQRAQVVVFHGGLATAVDLVCMGGSTPCLVELKCSVDNKYDHACGPMLAPMAGRTDSLRNQHILQSQMTHMLWESTYGPGARSLLMQVNAGGVSVTETTPAPCARGAFGRLIAACRPGSATPPGN